MPIQEIRLHNEAAMEVKGLGVYLKVAFAKVISVQIKCFPLVAQKTKAKHYEKQIHQRVTLSEVKSVILE